MNDPAVNVDFCDRSYGAGATVCPHRDQDHHHPNARGFGKRRFCSGNCL